MFDGDLVDLVDLVDLTYSISAWLAMGQAQHVLELDTACSFTPDKT